MVEARVFTACVFRASASAFRAQVLQMPETLNPMTDQPHSGWHRSVLSLIVAQLSGFKV